MLAASLNLWRHPVNDRIGATLSQADLDAILAAVETITSKLPFLVDLSPDDRQTLPKFGEKSLAFVQRAHDVVRQNDSFLPRSFDVDAFGRDVALRARLDTVALSRLAKHVDDTRTLVGAEAYAAALTAYDALKRSGRGTALDGAADDLARHFARRRPADPAS